MAALLSLIPLAATSTTGMIRRWARGTGRACIASPMSRGVRGAALHVAREGRVKDPYWYATALVILLGVRVWRVGTARDASAARNGHGQLARRKPAFMTAALAVVSGEP
jgi:DMSO/TMAO reductase YedYZ heme-binding membrane subunit